MHGLLFWLLFIYKLTFKLSEHNKMTECSLNALAFLFFFLEMILHCVKNQPQKTELKSDYKNSIFLRKIVKTKESFVFTNSTHSAKEPEISSDFRASRNSIFLLIFIFSHFDWICCDRTEGVCMYVCMYVCMCVTALQPKHMDEFWWNCLPIIWQIFVRSVFLGFWNFEIDDVMAAILYVFCWGTLTVAIFVRFSSKFNTR